MCSHQDSALSCFKDKELYKYCISLLLEGYIVHLPCRMMSLLFLPWTKTDATWYGENKISEFLEFFYFFNNHNDVYTMNQNVYYSKYTIYLLKATSIVEF